jgi:hypothetical protein
MFKQKIEKGHRLWSANNGKPTAKALLRKLLAAKALAAYDGYASTKNVHMPENVRKRSSTKDSGSEDGHDPMHMRIAAPCKPKQTNRDQHST